MNGPAENHNPDAERKFPEPRSALKGRMVRHVGNRQFYVIKTVGKKGVRMAYCADGTPKSAHSQPRARTWEQLARLYNLVPE